MNEVERERREYDKQQVEKRRIDKFDEIDFSKRHADAKIDIDASPEAWRKSCLYISEKAGTGVLLAIVGGRGTGKTQMVAEAARIRLRNWTGEKYITNFRYVRAMSIFMEIRSSYRQGSSKSEQRIISDHRQAGTLVIDEMHDRSDSEWENRILTHIIDLRYGDMKDTIMISNQTADEFAQQVGPSIISRLTETGGIIVCDWDSFRRSPTPAA